MAVLRVLTSRTDQNGIFLLIPKGMTAASSSMMQEISTAGGALVREWR